MTSRTHDNFRHNFWTWVDPPVWTMLKKTALFWKDGFPYFVDFESVSVRKWGHPAKAPLFNGPKSDHYFAFSLLSLTHSSFWILIKLYIYWETGERWQGITNCWIVKVVSRICLKLLHGFVEIATRNALNCYMDLSKLIHWFF